MPSAKALQRGCVALLRVKNNSFKTEAEVTIRGEFFQLLTPNGVVTKMFSCAGKVFFTLFFQTEQDVLKQL